MPAMPRAAEIETVCSGVVFWHVYDPAVKAELFSTCLETAAGTYLVDPIPLKPDATTDLTRTGVAGIIITNENHERAAALFAAQFQVPVYSALPSIPGITEGVVINQNQSLAPGLVAVLIDGAPAGEIAVHWEANGGTLVVGDALINFDPYGFTFLPSKYCRDFKQMCRSLEKLLEYQFERILFAHGTPIVSRARHRLETLLREAR
jgi:glyoxylase-like metal-dependent hydrolase (beta-lactamase superfamily II)